MGEVEKGDQETEGCAEHWSGFNRDRERERERARGREGGRGRGFDWKMYCADYGGQTETVLEGIKLAP